MTTVAIVYHSGYGHTQAIAEAVAAGAQGVTGVKTTLVPTSEAEAREAELDEVLEKLGEVAVRWQNEDRSAKKSDLKAA